MPTQSIRTLSNMGWIHKLSFTSPGLADSVVSPDCPYLADPGKMIDLLFGSGLFRFATWYVPKSTRAHRSNVV